MQNDKYYHVIIIFVLVALHNNFVTVITAYNLTYVICNDTTLIKLIISH